MKEDDFSDPKINVVDKLEVAIASGNVDQLLAAAKAALEEIKRLRRSIGFKK